MKIVVMPALGVAMSEGVLLAWLKEPGDAVREGEPIMEIETDKSTVSVESPVDGILGPHLFEPDAIVPVGAEMTRILEPGDEQPRAGGESEAASVGGGSADVATPEPDQAETSGGASSPSAR